MCIVESILIKSSYLLRGDLRVPDDMPIFILDLNSFFQFREPHQDAVGDGSGSHGGKRHEFLDDHAGGRSESRRPTQQHAQANGDTAGG